MRNNDPANGRRYHGVDPIITELRGELATDHLSVLGVLKNQRALEVARAVQPGR